MFDVEGIIIFSVKNIASTTNMPIITFTFKSNILALGLDFKTLPSLS
jgi:hypothetical protein